MKRLFSFFLMMMFLYAGAQNVGIGVPIPTERLHVDSVIKIGKNQALGNITTPGRVNALRFGDGNFVSISEEKLDDRLYIRYGDLVFLQSTNSAGLGYIGINTESPSAALHINGTLRLQGNGAAAGKVLTSDADGNATWQTPTTGSETKYLMVPFAAFSTLNNGAVGSFIRNENCECTYMGDGASGAIIAPVYLPANSTITKVTYYYVDNSASSNLTINFRYQVVSGGGTASVGVVTGASFTTTSQVATIRTEAIPLSYSTGSTSQPFYITVEPSDFGGWPQISSTVTTLRFSYAKIEYQ